MQVLKGKWVVLKVKSWDPAKILPRMEKNFICVETRGTKGPFKLMPLMHIPEAICWNDPKTQNKHLKQPLLDAGVYVAEGGERSWERVKDLELLGTAGVTSSSLERIVRGWLMDSTAELMHAGPCAEASLLVTPWDEEVHRVGVATACQLVHEVLGSKQRGILPLLRDNPRAKVLYLGRDDVFVHILEHAGFTVVHRLAPGDVEEADREVDCVIRQQSAVTVEVDALARSYIAVAINDKAKIDSHPPCVDYGTALESIRWVLERCTPRADQDIMIGHSFPHLPKRKGRATTVHAQLAEAVMKRPKGGVISGWQLINDVDFNTTTELDHSKAQLSRLLDDDASASFIGTRADSDAASRSHKRPSASSAPTGGGKRSHSALFAAAVAVKKGVGISGRASKRARVLLEEGEGDEEEGEEDDEVSGDDDDDDDDYDEDAGDGEEEDDE